MKHYSFAYLASLILAILLVITGTTGCTAIAGIFKAGVWTGIFIVAAVIALIIFLISRGSRNS